MNLDLLPPHIQPLTDPLVKARGVLAMVCRLDLLHTRYSGNKYYKLKGLAARMAVARQCRVASFGGRWSNHLLALAQYGADHGLETIGLVRDASGDGLSPLLQRCMALGMHIHLLTAAHYRSRHDRASVLLAERGWSHDTYILPEGGAVADAINNCEDIGAAFNRRGVSYNHLVVPVGTGATMAGLVRAVRPATVIHGIAVTKKYAQQQALIDRYNPLASVDWKLHYLPEFGRYGQTRAEIIRFIHRFERVNAIPLDPNYTAKAFYWFYQTLAQGGFASGESVVLLHTGGLFGRQGMPEVFAN